MTDIPFDIIMDDDGDDCTGGSGGTCRVPIVHLGPVTINARCDDRSEDGGAQDEQVAIEIHIDHDENLFVFGHLDDVSGMDGGDIDDFVLKSRDTYTRDVSQSSPTNTRCWLECKA